MFLFARSYFRRNFSGRTEADVSGMMGAKTNMTDKRWLFKNEKRVHDLPPSGFMGSWGAGAVREPGS
jgi:hypothetical protein